VRQSWLSPLAVSRDAGSKGRGIFAVAAIPAGTTVAGFGGNVVDRAELDALADEIRIHALQIDDDLFIASDLPFDDADFVNHSCDPNCGIVGSVLVVTMRDVAVGEELCFDYAMTDTDDYDEFTCSCGTASCRGTVTGADWKEPELRDRYRGWRSAYIARRDS
jgi:SET domain-containing protein